MQLVQFTNEIIINATPEEVANALANPEVTEKFWYGFRVNIQDSKITYYVEENVMIEGEILNFVPNSIIEMTFVGKFTPSLLNDKPSKVRWELEGQDGGINTYLKLTHYDMEEGSYSARVLLRGWVSIISSLKSLLETGKPLTIIPNMEE